MGQFAEYQVNGKLRCSIPRTTQLYFLKYLKQFPMWAQRISFSSCFTTLHGYMPLSIAHRIDLHSQGFTMFCKIRKVALHRGRELCRVRQAWLGLTLTSCLLTPWPWTHSLETRVLLLHRGGECLRGGAGGVWVPVPISQPCVSPLAAAAWMGAVSSERLLPASLTGHPPRCLLRSQGHFFPPCGWPSPRLLASSEPSWPKAWVLPTTSAVPLTDLTFPPALLKGALSLWGPFLYKRKKKFFIPLSHYKYRVVRFFPGILGESLCNFKTLELEFP